MFSNSRIIRQELVEAGAGAGKTTALIEKLIFCISSYYKKHNRFPRVVVSTFTRKATRELKERILVKAIELQDPDLIHYISYSSYLQISTLHGILNRFVQTFGYKIGFSPGMTIVNDKESDELFISILQEVLLEEKIGIQLLKHYSFEELVLIVKHYILYSQTTVHSRPISKKEMQNIYFDQETMLLKKLQKKGIKIQKELSELQLEKDQLDVFINLLMELEKIGKRVFQIQLKKKREFNQITLNDLESFAIQILQKEKNILNWEANKWDFWFLDEYQDTSKLQTEILSQLSQKSQVFIVGDPQQSIYYFRGAESSVFSQKKQEIKNVEHSKVKYLKKNYRSCAELVAFFNDFFPKEKFTKLEPAHTSYDKQKKVAYFNFIQPSQKKQEEGTSELQETKNRISYLIAKGAKPSEIVVLAKQNNILRELAQYLKNQGFPVHLHSSGSFKKRREVTDALLLLHFLLNPHDEENLIGLLRTPYCRIPDQILAEAVQKSIQRKNNCSLWEFFLEVHLLKKTANHRKQVISSEIQKGDFNSSLFINTKSIIQTLNYHCDNVKRVGIVNGFQSALEALNFIDLSYYQDPTGIGEANFWKFIYCLKNYEAKGSSSFFAFADHLFYDNFKMESDYNDYSQNAVSAIESSGIQLMTIHAAKGLEFKHVILIKVCAGFRHTEQFQYFVGDKETGRWAVSIRSEKEDKRIISSFHKKIREKKKNKEIEEWDRLLYVALTRAKETVTLIGSGTPGKHSWYNRVPFFYQLKPGDHQTDHYSYCVKYV